MLVFVIILSAVLQCSVKCSVQKMIEPQIYHAFSKTDYNRTKMFSAMSPYFIEEECKPARVWVMSRHGSKWPSEDVLASINDQLIPDIQNAVKSIYQEHGNDKTLNFENRLKKNQKIIIRSIINWENSLSKGSHKDLTERGKETMISFGQRLKEKLLPFVDKLKKDNIEVLSAKEWRCVLSGKKFLSSFFKGDHDDIEVKSSDSDSRLELIKPSNKEVEVNDPYNPGKKILVESLFLKKNSKDTIWRIKKMLFPDYINGYQQYREKVTESMILTMYHACALGYYFLDTNGKKLDVWCWLFTFDDLRMFENMQDLQYYYKNGYYLPNNIKMGNPLTNDLLNFLETPTNITFKLFIGHTSNCLSLITRFNLYRDSEHLTIDNIQNKNDRKWKTSSIAPFGCNIMAIVYDCGYTTFKVSIFVNESVIEIILQNGDKCEKCPLEDIINLIKSFKTEELNESSTTEDENKEKAKRKEKKAEEKRKEKADELQKNIKEELRQRLEEVFDENEEYWDTGEIPEESTFNV